MEHPLSPEAVERIRQLRSEFAPYAERGWMYEGTDGGWIVFNNNTGERFFATESGEAQELCLAGTSKYVANYMAEIITGIDEVIREDERYGGLNL